MNVSIIIPCFNGFRFMEKCLEALEKQTYKNFEVIIIDDNSTDDSYEKISEYAQRSKLKINLVKNEVNLGPGECRNRGISIAKGNWVAFCDCDDWYEINFIEKMLQKADKINADLVMCDNFTSTLNTRKKVGSTDFLNDNSITEDFIIHARMSLCRFLIKRQLLDDVKLPPIYNGEDGAVVPKIIVNATQIGVVNDALYNYRIRKGSGSTKPSLRVYEGLLLSFNEIENSIYNRFPKECEYIGIKIILYGATFNALRAGLEMNQVKSFVEEFTDKYPKWFLNPHITKFSRIKRLYLFCLKNNNYFVLNIYSRLFNLYLRYLT